MISDARGGHVSPGIYTEEKDVTYSVKSLGITSLGLVGETLYGPAFENIPIENWSEFVDYFGGTSPDKFKGTGLPKYELPYIAKSYLEESKRLNVVRVLGLSGYHAGPAWGVTCGGNIVAVLRSKMTYNLVNDDCEGLKKESAPVAKVTNITLSPYTEVIYDSVCVGSPTQKPDDTPGRFAITVSTNDSKTFKYNLSLNPSDGTYIYNVLSNRPDTGTTPVYIEALYESSWDGQSSLSIAPLTGKVTTDSYFVIGEKDNEGKYTITLGRKADVEPTTENTIVLNDEYSATTVSGVTLDNVTNKVYVKAKFATITHPYDNYLSAYRAAQTPWIVSDAVVTSESASVKKLFKFITISDGNAANYQVKVSIQNIDPVSGTFDVVVRDFYDKDELPIILERFTKCDLVEGSANYIAYKIGTADGGFVAKSKYILVEMANGEDLKNNIPAGFMGYPMPEYAKEGKVKVTYNTTYNPEIKTKKQYFGFSDITGIEMDILSYKGIMAYEGNVTTNGFHMDSVLTTAIVDGDETHNFTSVSQAKVTHDAYVPRLVNMSRFINNSLYKDIKTRKFTVCFYGGFDGWDVNREQRTNTDDYKASVLNVDENGVFTNIAFGEGNLPLNLPSTATTSDYYAYLAGCRVFANPQDIDINVFATPGINWLDHKLLTEEVIDMIEDAEDGRGGDALYVMAAPADMDASKLAEEFNDTDINSSYACTYAPWVMYYDASNRKYINLPVTKDVVRNMAATDNNSYPWFAPAGIERGDVKCVKAEYKTTLANEDDLYENRINPVKSFAQDGVKIWGNKTAYNADSPLNRINVRRLMIRVKKLVTNAAKNLIFTQYDDTLEKQFRGLIEPILAEVKSNRGISDYRIMTEVTPETRDQHILPAKILIKPTPALEYISISFVVYPESVSFDEN